MNTFFITALLRIAMSVAGGWLLTLGFTQDQVNAVSATVNSGHGIGTIILGVVAIVVPVVWAKYSTTAARLIDKAVHVSGGQSSPLAPKAAEAKVAATKKT